MTNFWDLPRSVRDKIYRLSLVQDKPITLTEHEKIVNYHSGCTVHRHFMPPLLQLSKKAENEAAPVYYRENEFDLGDTRGIRSFASMTWPRHFKFVRKLSFQWATSWSTGYGRYGYVREEFLRLSKMKGLEDLTIRVDEADMMKHLSVSREVRQQSLGTDLTWQQQLAIFRFPAMTGLLAITNVKHVRFAKLVDKHGIESGGPIEGGALLTHVLPRLRPNVKLRRRKNTTPFRFLDLPPELRNRVYDLLLRIPGPIHPSTDTPTTAPKDKDNIKVTETEHHDSALSILAVNKQMHDEAIGVFYNANEFVFYYPVQLNAFLTGIGPQRASLIQSLTIHYHSLRIGGVDLADLTFPLLKQMKSLKKLHIIMNSALHETILRSHWLQIPLNGWRSRGPVYIWNADPGQVPGFRYLFELRGVTDILIRDIKLEEKVEEAKKDTAYPNFSSNSTSDVSNTNFLLLARAYEHFNKALKDSQVGKVNKTLLEGQGWHMKEPFPDLEEVKEEAEENDGDEDEDEDEDEAGNDNRVADSDFDFDA